MESHVLTNCPLDSYVNVKLWLLFGTGLAMYIATGFSGVWPGAGMDGVVRVMAG
jgi:hypothetical protein